MSEARRESRPSAQYCFQLAVGQIVHVKLDETIAESKRELLSSPVQPCWILCGKQLKRGVWRDHLLRLGDEQLAIVIKQSVEGLENFRRGQVELIEDDPGSTAKRRKIMMWARQMGRACALLNTYVRMARTSKPSVKTSLPDTGSGTYVPKYSARSVCS